MNKYLRNSSIVLLSLALSGCGHALPFVKDKPKTTTTVCDKVDEPPREPLANFTFFPLPPGTTAPGGVNLVAGLTADGVADILGNHQKLQKRDQKWQTRAQAVNKCLDQEAADRAKVNAK